MSDYKYRFYFNGDTYVGNSVDDIASKISKDANNDISFTQAVSIVNKGLIPVSKTFFDKSESVINAVKESYKGKTNLTVDQMTHGATAVLKQAMGDVVQQSEVRRRADICFNCPKRTSASFCKACGQASKITRLVNKVKGLFGKGVKIPSGLDQDYCTVCGCSLAMLLAAPLKQIDEATKKDESRPFFCWMKEQ